MTEINPIMVETLAKMTGKSEAEVLKFLEKKDSPPEGVAPVKTHEEAKGEVVISKEVVTLQPKNQENKNAIPPDVELELAETLNTTKPTKVDPEAVKRMVENMRSSEKLINTMPTARELENAKSKAPESKEVVDEVITEEVAVEDLTSEQLEDVEDNQFASTSIRVGSKVRCTWQPDAGKGKIKWVGKTGTVIQKISDKGVSIYLVEFPAGKIPFQRLNKETGKLQRGYHTKKLQQWMDEGNLEEVF